MTYTLLTRFFPRRTAKIMCRIEAIRARVGAWFVTLSLPDVAKDVGATPDEVLEALHWLKDNGFILDIDGEDAPTYSILFEFHKVDTIERLWDEMVTMSWEVGKPSRETKQKRVQMARETIRKHMARWKAEVK